MSEDFIMELAILERETIARIKARNMREQKGEAFAGIKTFPMPSRPFRQSEEQR